MDVNAFIGKTLEGRYNVKGTIGKGGSARVFYAEDTLLHRTVALKILENDKNELGLNTKSFDTEAKAISMLSHPNIVSVYDISVGGNVKYIVMEYVEGITLRKYLDNRKILPPTEVVSCARQVLRALCEAHGKGIVHRDIKPQNIMIMKTGQIKVADFGIARLPGLDRFLMEDRAIGTVHYISPEQAKGGQVDRRSDIYSLGIVMYEMATGVRPFESENLSEVAVMQVTDTPARPTEINPELPRELETVIMCALSKNPDNRYDSAYDMLRVLERISFEKKETPIPKVMQNPFSRLKQMMTKTEKEEEYDAWIGEDETLPEEEKENSHADDTMEIPFASDSEIEKAFERAEAISEFDEADYDYEDFDSEAYAKVTEEAEEIEEFEEIEPEEEIEETEEEIEYAEEIYATEAEEDENVEEDEDDAPTRLIYGVGNTENEEYASGGYGYYEYERKEKERKNFFADVLRKIKENARAIAIAVGAIALVAVVVLAVFVLANANKKHTVPNYEGQHYITIDDASIFKFVTESEPSSAPEGTVIGQSPAAGEKLREGDTVTIIISEGPRTIPLVLDAGYRLDDVLVQLEAAFDAYEISVSIKTKYEYSDTVAEGVIFSYLGEVRDGGVITLRVSAGKDKQYVELPDFVGKRLSDAVAFLVENDIAYGIEISADETEKDVGTVVAQSISAGEKTEKYVESGKVILTVGALSK